MIEQALQVELTAFQQGVLELEVIGDASVEIEDVVKPDGIGTRFRVFVAVVIVCGCLILPEIAWSCSDI